MVVPVTNQNRAIEFYVGKLGLELRSDMSLGDGDRWIEVAGGSGHADLARLPRPGDPTGLDTRIGLTTKDIEADQRR